MLLEALIHKKATYFLVSITLITVWFIFSTDANYDFTYTDWLDNVIDNMVAFIGAIPST